MASITVQRVDFGYFVRPAEETGTGAPRVEPCLGYVVGHPAGPLLFDTGVHCQVRVDPISRMGPERAKRLTDRSKAGEDIVPQLALLGLAPDDVRYVANSHLHFDHCGGNEFFPRSTFLVQKAEMDAARRPGFAPGYNPSPLDFDHPLDYRLVDGEHDVFGDGTVIMKLAAGHTPGHQILYVNLPKTGGVVLGGDLYHFQEARTLKRVATVDFDQAQSAVSREIIENFLAKTGSQLWIQHDLAGNTRLRKAPAYYE